MRSWAWFALRWAGTCPQSAHDPRPDVQLFGGRSAGPAEPRLGTSTGPVRTRSTTSPRPPSSPISWRTRLGTVEAIAGGTAALLAGVLAARAGPAARSRRDLERGLRRRGGSRPSDESTPMRPASPYGVAKLAAHGLVGTMRAHHGCCTSPRAPSPPDHESAAAARASFLPRKVTRGAAAIALGPPGGARARGPPGPCATGATRRPGRRARRAPHGAGGQVAGRLRAGLGAPAPVGELVDTAFAARRRSRREGRIRVDPAFVRPAEATPPVGDPTRARERAGLGSPRSRSSRPSARWWTRTWPRWLTRGGLTPPRAGDLVWVGTGGRTRRGLRWMRGRTSTPGSATCWGRARSR